MAVNLEFCIDWSAWERNIRNTKCFSRCLGKKWKIIACNILAVDCRIKPSYLLDIGVKHKELLNALLYSCYIQGLTANHLKLLQLKQDILIFCTETLYKHIQDVLSYTAIWYIDVSHGQDTPKICENTKSVAAVECDELNKISQAIAENHRYIVQVNISDECNLSTIFGQLLGYPCVYWYQNDEKDQGFTCLEMEPLHVYQVYGTCDDMAHIIYSYSVPEALVNSILQEHVTRWFQQLQRSMQDKIVFKKLSLSHEIVTLPCPML